VFGFGWVGKGQAGMETGVQILRKNQKRQEALVKHDGQCTMIFLLLTAAVWIF